MTNILLVDPALAAAIGLNEAIVLSQLDYWLAKNKEKEINFKEGRYWTFNTYSRWREQFPFWSERTVRRTLVNLEKMGLIMSGCYNKTGYDKTKWYTILYENLPLSLSPNGEMHSAEQRNGSGQNDLNDTDNMDRPIPENTKENNKKNGLRPPALSYDLNVYENKNVIDKFIPAYYRLYFMYKSRPHPHLKDEQKYKIYGVLDEYISEYFLEAEELAEMAVQFFTCGIRSDHNLCHFATRQVLNYRMYESLYRVS